MAPASRKLLVVLGATGHQGEGVLKSFVAHQAEFPFALRGTTRDPSSPASKKLTELGVEMVACDFDDENSLRSALSGATHVFANTTSPGFVIEALQQPQVLADGELPKDYARRRELAQGRNIANAAATTPSLERLIWSSLPGPKKWSKGKYTGATMLDTKEDIGDMLESTEGLRGKTSILQVGFYATNALDVPMVWAPQKLADGTFELALPVKDSRAVPIADVDVDIGSWVQALFELPPGTVLVGATEVLTWQKWLEQWASHNNVHAKFRSSQLEEFGSKIPGITDVLGEGLVFIEEYGYDGGRPGALWPDDVRKRGIDIQRSTLADQIKRTDWSSTL